MNRKNRAKSSSLFLLELILAILFFSIASAVCVQIFVKSHLLSKDAQALNLAISECTGAAEIITTIDNADTLIERFDKIGPYTVEGNEPSAIYIYYDKAMQPCSQTSGIYQMTIRLDWAETMVAADITMNDLTDQSSIYQLQVVHHLQREAANES